MNTINMASQEQEQTYKAYTPAQGLAYAKSRGSYPQELYNHILSHHTSTSGQLSTLIDVGCGPSNGIRPLAPHFANAIGLDPSASIISTALSIPSSTASGAPIQFHVSTAEDLGSPSNSYINIPDASVDMITAATAAHWFDLPRFYRRAASLLKPGGTLALWTASSVYVHPRTPNYERIKNIIFHLDCEVLVPYLLPGNDLARDLYRDLLLPWTIEPPEPAFSERDFARMEWNRDGDVSVHKNFFFRHERVGLEEFAKVMGTSSAVMRWREANLALIGTEKDCVQSAVREIKEALREVVVREGEEMIETGWRGRC